MRVEDIADKLPAAGLAAGALAWATSTELNYALAPTVCIVRWPLIPVAAALLALIALAGIYLSAVAWRRDRAHPSTAPSEGGVQHKLLAGIGIGSGVLFTIIIILQGSANLFLSGCE